MDPITKFLFPIVLRSLSVVEQIHSMKVAAKRYVDAVTGEGQYKDYTSGSFVASKHGGSGSVADQVKIFATAKQYADVTKQDAMYAAMNEYL